MIYSIRSSPLINFSFVIFLTFQEHLLILCMLFLWVTNSRLLLLSRMQWLRTLIRTFSYCSFTMHLISECTVFWWPLWCDDFLLPAPCWGWDTEKLMQVQDWNPLVSRLYIQELSCKLITFVSRISKLLEWISSLELVYGRAYTQCIWIQEQECTSRMEGK